MYRGCPSCSLPPNLTWLSLTFLFDAWLVNVTCMYLAGLSSAFVTFCLSNRLWFDELISLWMSVQNLPSWEVVSRPICFENDWVYSCQYFCLQGVTCCPTSLQHLVNLFARLANDNIGYIDWDPYIPKVCCPFFPHHPRHNLEIVCFEIRGTCSHALPDFCNPGSW